MFNPTMETIFKDARFFGNQLLHERDLTPALARLTLYIIGGSAFYGFTMGLHHSFLQAAASAIKVPMLLFVTLLICLPTLYFVSLFFGSRIRFAQAMVVLLTGLSITAVLLGSFAPIALFFLLSGSSYTFLLLLHVTIFAFCSLAGLYSIQRHFHYLAVRVTDDLDQMVQVRGRVILQLWIFLYMFVGSQMAYVLAPFVGRDLQFVLFRLPETNLYTYLLQLIGEIINR
ncbi:MAG: actin-binding WH2 domain-containing protein [Anaerolineae bacterium]|nr:actin-binding WH2 domain-containing protein [Anaerolineae bacterium]